MKRYEVKSAPGRSAVLDILSSSSGGFRVRITRRCDGFEEVEESFMTEDLFELCLTTAYIRELSPAVAHVA